MTTANFNEPSTGTVNSPSPALTISNTGTGPALSLSASIGVKVNTSSRAALGATNDGGPAGEFSANSPSPALTISNTGTGPALSLSASIGVKVNTSSRAALGATNDGGPAGEFSANSPSPALTISNTGTGPAGSFVGNVSVTGDITLLGADCAEEFDLSTTDLIDPGTVMVLNQSGNLERSNQPYDKKVAGIVSGAGNYKAALVLDKKNGNDTNKRVPIALMGKVYCKVDATLSPIEIGDLLTTSTTKGHAMKAEDPFKAFGAVIGKALGSVKEGIGLIPILVALQ
jgi:hypothetical protein